MTTAIMPPLVIDVRVKEPGKKGFRIWFPFFLLWPLMLVVVGFALLITAIVDSASWFAGARYHHYTLLLLGAMHLLAESRGTRAHVTRRDDARVDVDIY